MTAPLRVNVLPEATVIAPPLMLNVRAVVVFPVKVSVPSEPAVTAPEPGAASEATATVPFWMLTPPPNELLPPRVSVPDPSMVRPAGPLTGRVGAGLPDPPPHT